ncbi:ABC1 kinase family protein [Hathewaya limosa]|uniref:Ubiquinone biosynthesis protein n=1 Tax=Hathewaya limosa TaxID=1536 RepID=A0ABU0JY15_HATLI|nr:AarF/ABC1/UbiB kinase family protein [Hathewaya limosa]MDQ0480984.1 ubiquinone biosynthesis protein [Hathewaya limosa]
MYKNSVQRFKEIVKILAHYGFGSVVDKKIKRQDESSPKNLRKAFEELGPTFIKIGQILSTRPDILPDPYIDELSKLQNNVPAECFEAINNVFENTFNISIKKAFKSFDEKPLASASIAQVHKATLFSGENVIVKIQRPNIKKQMNMDIEILSKIFSLAKSKLSDFIIDPQEALEELRYSTELELDFTNEVKNMKKFREFNKECNYVYSPNIVENFSSNKVITMEMIDGFNINNFSKLREYNYDREDIGKKLILSFFKQVFEDNFFHADPHPGNLLIYNGKICFIDFGLMGSLSKSLQEALNELIMAIVYEDIHKIISIIMSIGIKTGYVDRNNLYEDIDYILSAYMSTSLKNIKMSDLIQEILKCAKDNNLKFPKDLTMLIRSLVIVEGVAVKISPDINIMSIAKPYVKSKNKTSLFSDFNLDNSLIRTRTFIKDTSRMPTKFVELSDSFLNGRAKLQLKIHGLEKSIRSLNRMVNRIVFALIIASMIISSSIILVYNIGPKILNISILGISGYLLAAFMGLWLLISIIRSGKL